MFSDALCKVDFHLSLLMEFKKNKRLDLLSMIYLYFSANKQGNMETRMTRGDRSETVSKCSVGEKFIIIIFGYCR